MSGKSDDHEMLSRLLCKCGLISSGAREQVTSQLQIEVLAGDGSARRFWRIRYQGEPLCLAAAPASSSVQDLAEARSARLIGLHLYRQGGAVPNQYDWDEESGLILFEDLGDEKLYDAVIAGISPAGQHDSERLMSLYQPVVEILAHLQIKGLQGFDPGWCWDTEHYDLPLMLERESGYFFRALWQDLLGQTPVAGLDLEFDELAHRALGRGSEFFLHRDFQSRNVMIVSGKPQVIDFQGGRLGPSGYDLASLLIDPYVQLPETVQERLQDCYLRAFTSYQPGGADDFQQSYPCLAVQRNLQILGAFAYLSRVRGKVFFARFLAPALAGLERRLAGPLFSDFPILRRISAQASRLFHQSTPT